MGLVRRQSAAILGLAACLLAAASSLFAQPVPGRYIVILSNPPAGRRPELRPMVRQLQADVRRAVPNHGGAVLETLDTVLNGLIVDIPDSRAAELAQIPGVVQVQQARWEYPTLDHALPLHQVPAAWAALPLGQNSAGAGAKVAILDSGIDVNNPAFSDPLPPLAGFPMALTSADLKYTNAKIIVAKNYTRLLLSGGESDADDHMGHGTGTSMAAAGGPAVSTFGPIIGVAPKAYIGNYKVLSATGGTTSDVLTKAIDDAVADGMDVINLSLGAYVTSYADVTTSDPAIAALEAAAAAGVVVTVSAGNAGPGPGSIENLASAPDVIAVGAINNDRTLGLAVHVDGGGAYQSAPGSGPNPGQSVSGPLLDAATLDPTGQVCSPLPAGSATGMIVLIQRGNCSFETKINDAAAGGAAAAVIYNNTNTGLINMQVGSATLPAVFIVQADGADIQSRIGATSGLTATVDFSVLSSFRARPDLTTFSSRGPSVTSAMKPDLVAVGDNLITATQRTYSSGELYDPSGFVMTAGTSFSAPLTAGAAAILKAARPGLSSAQYRSLLINNANAANAGPGTLATVQQAGAGVLNVAAALSGTATVSPTAVNFGVKPANATQNLTITNIGSVTENYSISVIPSGGGPVPLPSSTTVQLDPGNSQTVSFSLAAPGLAAGEYQGSIKLTGSVNPSPVNVPYWFAANGTSPAGISVLWSDDFDSANSTASEAVVFRVVDVAGLPLSPSSPPQVVVSAGVGSVRGVYRVGSVPGTYAIDIRTGASSMQLAITAGDATQTVTIPVL